MTTLRILLADDHEVVRRGIRALLETQPGWQVCDEAQNGREAVRKASSSKPDVVVLDIGMPELNGLEATRQIRKALPQTEVLILTMHESEQIMREVLGAGAGGFVNKSEAASRLVDAVRTLARHKPFFSSRATGMGVGEPLGKTPGRRGQAASPLSAREREVLQLLAEGCTNKEVATKLGISVRTAETHRTNIMSKLSLHSMNELVRYAIRNRIING